MESNSNTTKTPEALPTFNEVLQDIDQSIKPTWELLMLLYACKEIANTRELTLREQLHTWRPFDV